MKFEGRVLFATGAGSGIGAETVQRYAAEGGMVAVTDIDLDKARAVAATLPNALALVCDVASEASVTAAVDATQRHFGRLDSVFNSAGHAIFGTVEKTSLDAWNLIMAVHVTGTFLVCRAAMPLLRRGGGGAIVNMASVAAIVGRPQGGAYAAAKGAILAFSRQLAADAATDRIRVNVIAPGPVKTAMTIPFHTRNGEGDWERGATLAAQQIPLKRVGDPAEIAAPVCFLLSDEASYITGTMFVADGGMTAI